MSQDPFHLLAESSPDAIFFGAQGRFVYLNPAALQLFGANSGDQLLGQPVVERIHADQRTAAAERMQRLFDHGEKAPLREETYLRLDGTPVQVEVLAVPFHREDRAGGLVFVRDISARKRAEAESRRHQQLMQAIVDNTTAVIFAKDLDGRYLLINRRYSELFHISNEAMLGRRDQDLFPPAVAAALAAADRQVLEAGAAVEFEEVVPVDDGPHTYIATKFPLRDAEGRPYAVCGIATDITERKRAEEEIRALNQNLEQRVAERTRELQAKEEFLARREREFRSLADNVPDNIIRLDHTGRVLYVNKTLEATLGRSAAELFGRRAEENFPDGRFTALQEAMLRVAASGESAQFEQQVPGPDGTPRYHAIRIVAEPGSDGLPASVLAVGRDVTAQRRVEEELRLAASVFHSSAEGVLITDAGAKILSVNPAFTEITGYTAAEAVGRKVSLLRSDHHEPAFYQAMWRQLLEAGSWQGEIWNRRKGGEAYLEWLTINVVRGHDGKPARYVSVFHDITESRRKDERLRHLAFHDALTDLPNRALFQERLEHALSRARRDGDRLSVTFVDLDGFKAVNDRLGHDIGDLLLQEVARRIRARMRRGADTVARLGGDEFVVLMEDLAAVEHCACLAGEIIADIAQPMVLRGHTVQVGASMGIAFFPEDGADAQELMKRADCAMYAAKAAGKGRYRFFSGEIVGAVAPTI